MTHLNITQGNTVELVSASLIKKLYETALSVSEPLEGETDAAYLSGHISVPYTYESYVNYLAGTIGEGNAGVVTSQRSNAGGRFLNLTIDVTNGYYIPFEDPKMATYLNSIGVGSGGAVTTTEAAAATFVATTQNTEITKFNELRYFTNVTESKDGWTGTGSGYIRFMDWTALEEVDISNFTSVGHNNGNGYQDTFLGCTSLKKVTASSKLTKFGNSAFLGCSNLEDITGLSGTILLYNKAFYNCSKLKTSNFTNTYISFYTNNNNEDIARYAFENCTSLTSINLHPTVTTIPGRCFKGCTNLASIDLSNITTISDEYSNSGAFDGCTSLTSLDLSECTYIGSQAFYGCSSLTTVTGSKITDIKSGAFTNCSNLTTIDTSHVGKLACTNYSRGLFAGCSSLTSIDLSSCTELGLGVFNGCSSLTNIIGISNILSSLNFTTVPNRLFNSVPFTTTLNLPYVTTIGEYAFANNSLLTSVSMPLVETIGSGAFSGCTNLTGDLIIPYCTTIGTTAFKQTQLNSLIANAVTSVPGQIFYLGSIKNVSMNSLETVPADLFDHTDVSSLGTISFNSAKYFNLSLTNSALANLILSLQNIISYKGNGLLGWKKLDLGPNLTEFGQSLFKRQYCSGGVIIIRATSVPTCAGFDNVFGSSHTKFYVPDASVTAYLTAWPNVASNIYPLSQFATDYPNDIT